MDVPQHEPALLGARPHFRDQPRCQPEPLRLADVDRGRRTAEAEPPLGQPGQGAVAGDITKKGDRRGRAHQRPIDAETPLRAPADGNRIVGVLAGRTDQQCAAPGFGNLHREAECARERVAALVGAGFEILDAKEQPREVLVDPEPDQQQRQDHQITAANDEPLELETLAAGDEQAGDEIKRDQGRGRQRSLAPAPANRGGQERQHEEQEERTGRAVGRENDRREHRHVDRVGRHRKSRIEPPVAPRHDGNGHRQKRVEDEQGIAAGDGLERFAAIEPDREQEQNSKHHAAERDDPAALIFEQVPRGGQLLQKTPLKPKSAPS